MHQAAVTNAIAPMQKAKQQLLGLHLGKRRVNNSFKIMPLVAICQGLGLAQYVYLGIAPFLYQKNIGRTNSYQSILTYIKLVLGQTGVHKNGVNKKALSKNSNKAQI